MSCNCSFCKDARNQRLREDLNAMYEKRVASPIFLRVQPDPEADWQPNWLAVAAACVTGLCFFWVVYAVGKEIGHQAGVF